MQNILQEEDHMKLTRQDANQLIPSLESAYYGLLIQGKYLPKLTSSIITSDYLLGVLFDRIYVPKLEEVQIGVLLKSVTKYELIQEILKIPIQQQIWGIDSKRTPDKDWIINVLKTLKPNHVFFQKYKSESKYDMKMFTSEQYNKIKELDLSMGKKSNVKRFFRISKDKQQEAGLFKKNLKKKNLEVKIERKNKLIEEYERDIQQIENRIKDLDGN